MAKASRIRAELQSAGRGGHVVAVGDDVVTSLGLKQHSRVKGTIGATPYRSSTARYGGVMYLGVHKATVEDAGLAVGDSVDVTIELDPEPREIDIPPDLARVLEADPKAKAAWDALSPSHQRQHARAVADAKRATTRARRIERTIDALLG
jgi:bacteriocin resistance YdeI/OmpD-like protein/uncharacterized protein DUF1905